MIDLSVIIPIYNGESFVKQCFYSLNMQSTDRQIEVIFVNDGSTDRTSEILKDEASKNNRFIPVILNKENGGVSSARNQGIDKARGEYLTFVDIDDNIVEDYFDTYLNSVEDDCDLLIGGLNMVDENGKSLLCRKPNNNSKWAKYQVLPCYGKLYKTAFIKENNIRFQGLKIAEDVVWCCNNYYLAKNIKIINYAGYLYYCNPNSVMRDDNAISCNPVIDIVKCIIHIVELYQINNDEIDNIVFCARKTATSFVLAKYKHVTTNDMVSELKVCYKYIDDFVYKTNMKDSLKFHNNETVYVNIIVFITRLCYRIGFLKPLVYMMKKIKKD